MSDPIIQSIETYRCRRGPLSAERRNRGYTLYHAGSGAPVARLRPTAQGDRVEVLHWSLWKEKWTNAGPFGRTVLMLISIIGLYLWPWLADRFGRRNILAINIAVYSL